MKRRRMRLRTAALLSAFVLSVCHPAHAEDFKLEQVPSLASVPAEKLKPRTIIFAEQRSEKATDAANELVPFDEWTSVFGSERLTGALLDRLTHHVHILEMNGESYRLAHSKRRAQRSKPDTAPDDPSRK